MNLPWFFRFCDCYCHTETETSNHFLLCCQVYIIVARKIFSVIDHISHETFNLDDNGLVMLIFYGPNNLGGNSKAY